MSYTITVAAQIKSLADLQTAAPLLGLEFREGQTSYKTHEGRPRCAHALVLAGATHEIGVIARGDAWDLAFDPYMNPALERAVGGRQMDRLKQEVSVAAHMRTARAKLGRKGFTVTRQNLPNGRVNLRVVRR